MQGQRISPAKTLTNLTQNARELSLNPQTFNSPITVYNCFRCGVTLLQCLAVQPTILPLRRTLRAISAVSSALAVYCRVVPTAEPLLRLFDMLSDQFLGDGEHPTVWNPNLSNLRSILQRIISAGPSETLEYVACWERETDRGIHLTDCRLYKILTEEEGDTAHTPLSQAAVDENESVSTAAYIQNNRSNTFRETTNLTFCLVPIPCRHSV